MRYYKTIIDNYIVSVGTGAGETEITESEYNELLSIIHNRPTPSTGFDYKMTADTLKWERVELPQPTEVDEDATEFDYIEALNTLGVDTNEEN